MHTKREMYQNILKYSKEIRLLIQLGQYEKIDMVLDKRAPFIEQVDKQDFEFGEIKVLIDEINSIDSENMKNLTEAKTDVYGRIRDLSRNKNVLALYKIQDSQTGLVDERD